MVVSIGVRFFCCLCPFGNIIYLNPETNQQQRHLKNGWLEDDFSFGDGFLAGALLVLGRVYFEVVARIKDFSWENLRSFWVNYPI